MWQIWLIVAGFFLILEIITTGFLVFWFSIGALIAMCSSFFIENVIVQTAIFLISSTILLFITKSFVQKITKKDANVKTNVYSIENKIGKVICRDPFFFDYNIKFEDGTEDWIDDIYIEKYESEEKQ